MYEFKATIPDGCKVLEAYSVSHGKASAWLPVLELLKSYFDLADEDDDSRRSEKVEAKVRGLDLTSEALNAMANYSWPGNVRELKSVVERGPGPSEYLTPP
jgi:hypothetical protein